MYPKFKFHASKIINLFNFAPKMKVLLNKKINTDLFYKLIICVISLFAVFFYLDYEKIYALPPMSTHHWRQCDGFSMTLNFYQFNLSLFKPELHHLLGNNGKAVEEFPILYYITAQLFRIFGVSYAVFRIVHFLPLLLSLLYLAYFLLKKVNLPLICVLPVVLCWFSYPLITYYALNYLPNVPSIGFFIVGGVFLLDYLFYDTTTSKLPKKLAYATLFLTLSATLKPTTLTSYSVFMGVIFLGWIFPRFLPCIKKEKKLFALLSFATVLLISFIWFSYAHYYTKSNKSNYFIVYLLPYWDIDPEHLKFINWRIREQWLPTIAHSSMIKLAIVSGVFVMVSSIIKKHYFVPVFFVGTFILDTIILLLWYGSFADHDYYFINFYGFPFVIFVLSLYYLHSFSYKHEYFLYLKNLVFAFVLMLIVWNFQQSRKVLEERYAPGSPWKENFNTYFYDPNLKKFIASLGFTPRTKVVSVPDGSTNNTLSMLNLKGITHLFDGGSVKNWHHDLSDLPQTAKMYGIKYLVVCSPEWLQREDFKRIKTKHLGNFESIHFFELLE